tara:strand:- start:2300 stop:2494 length:195 start_codon:yes stop_codon:yes gene_type:complete
MLIIDCRPVARPTEDEVKRWLALPRPNPKRGGKVVIRRRGDVETRRSMSVLGHVWKVTTKVVEG